MNISDRPSATGDPPHPTRPADVGRPHSSWFDLLRQRVTNVLGLKSDPDEPVGVGTASGIESDQNVLVRRLRSRKKPEQLTRLLDEAVALLAPADRLAIGARLSGDGPSAVACRIGVEVDAVGQVYATAVGRLVERLAWVAAEEARGISPPERKVLGQGRFFGRSAQEIATMLSLPLEVVESWLREAGPPIEREPGVPP